MRAEAWPDARDADELHDVLQTLMALPAIEASGMPAKDALAACVVEAIAGWRGFFEELREQRRAVVGFAGGGVIGWRRSGRRVLLRLFRRRALILRWWMWRARSRSARK